MLIPEKRGKSVVYTPDLLNKARALQAQQTKAAQHRGRHRS
jgi:hypothetical protein